MSIILRIALELLAAVLLALGLRRHVFLLVFVKGHSMMDTLRNADLVFATRRHKGNSIKRFDVVLCRYPNRRELFIKRVIALPNEVISMAEDTIFINGEAIEENYPRRRCMRKIEETRLADNEYFVMGDNRSVSRDSRAKNVGPIPDFNIVAVVRGVILPLRRARKI